MTRRVTIREPKPWEQSIGDLVYQGRVRLNLTQEELGASVRVAQKQISHIERNQGQGIKEISLSKFVRVFEALGYDADLAYYKAGQLPPDVMDILSANWKLYQGVVSAARSVKGEGT